MPTGAEPVRGCSTHRSHNVPYDVVGGKQNVLSKRGSVSVPATSVASEQLFLKAGDVITDGKSVATYAT